MKKLTNIFKPKNLLSFVIIFLVFSTQVNFFKSLYLLSFRGYEERMYRTYGWGCDVPNAYQFTKQIIETYLENERNFYIHNFHTSSRYWIPPINSLFLNLEIDQKKDKLILLHYYKEHTGTNFKSIDVNLDNYNKITSVPGCAYFEKK